jgi:hypothetical protein
MPETTTVRPGQTHRTSTGYRLVQEAPDAR